MISKHKIKVKNFQASLFYNLLPALCNFLFFVGNKELTDKKKGANIPPLLRRETKLTKKYPAIFIPTFLYCRFFYN